MSDEPRAGTGSSPGGAGKDHLPALDVGIVEASTMIREGRYEAGITLLEALRQQHGNDPRLTGRLNAARALKRQQRGKDEETNPGTPLPGRGRAPAPTPPVMAALTIEEPAPLPPPPRYLSDPAAGSGLDPSVIEVLATLDGAPPAPTPGPPPAPAPPPVAPAPRLAEVIPLRSAGRSAVPPAPVAASAPAPAPAPAVRGPVVLPPLPEPSTPAAPLAPVQAVVPPAPASAPRRRRVLVALAAVLLLGGAALLAFTLRGRAPSPGRPSATASAEAPAPDAVPSPPTRASTPADAPMAPGTREVGPATPGGDRPTQAGPEVGGAPPRTSPTDPPRGAVHARPPGPAATAGAMIRLRLTITPANAPATVIFRRAAYPGTTFESPAVPSTTTAEEVKIKAPGFERVDLRVTLDRDQELRVELKKASKRMRLFDF